MPRAARMNGRILFAARHPGKEWPGTEQGQAVPDVWAACAAGLAWRANGRITGAGFSARTLERGGIFGGCVPPAKAGGAMGALRAGWLFGAGHVRGLAPSSRHANDGGLRSAPPPAPPALRMGGVCRRACPAGQCARAGLGASRAGWLFGAGHVRRLEPSSSPANDGGLRSALIGGGVDCSAVVCRRRKAGGAMCAGVACLAARTACSFRARDYSMELSLSDRPSHLRPLCLSGARKTG